MMRTAQRVGVAVMLSLAATAIAAAQDALKPADVEKFMGTWVLNLDSPQGSFAMNFSLTEKEGKVTRELITLTPSGDKAVNLVFDVNNGQFMMNGTGTKK
jgi:hypothetical protein